MGIELHDCGPLTTAPKTEKLPSLTWIKIDFGRLCDSSFGRCDKKIMEANLLRDLAARCRMAARNSCCALRSKQLREIGDELSTVCCCSSEPQTRDEATLAIQ
jgi:hypothetical protein